MRPHLTILAVLHIARGLFGLFVAIVTLLGSAAAGAAVAFMPDIPGWIGALAGTVGALVGIFFAVLALPEIALGYGFLARKSWARPLGFVVSVLSLIDFPIGTVVGAYTIWVLLQPETTALLGRHADPAFR